LAQKEKANKNNIERKIQAVLAGAAILFSPSQKSL
jgi:hypothetical protein